MSVAAAIIAGVGAASSIGSAVIGSKAAGKAARAQEDSAKYAADLQKESADDSLAFQRKVYSDQKTNQQPYLDEGKKALGQLDAGMAPGGQFTQTMTADNFRDLDPGFDFRMSESAKAIERAQAAGGSIGSGGALKAATRYAQDYASGEFSNAFQRFKSTQDTNFNRWSSLAGEGQTATQSVNANGTAAAGNIANINGTYATNAGNDYMAAGNAAASGYMGQANAWGSGLNGLSNAATSMATMMALGKYVRKN